MLYLTIAGIIFGILAGPGICFLLSIGIYKLRERGEQSKIDKINLEHRAYIDSLRRKHEKLQGKYAKTQEKIIKLVDKKT
jgi:hypothetical protein